MNTASRIAARTGLIAGLAGLFVAGPFGFAQNPAAPNATPTAAAPSPVAAPAPSAAAPAQAAPNAAAQPSPPAPVPALKPAPEALPSRQGVDSLSDGDIRQALELLKANYINPSALTEDALARATLQGMLERLDRGALIEQPGTAVATESPFRAEILDDRIGYLRLGTLGKGHLAELDAALGNFATKKLRSLILDLRATPASSDFELAAEYIKRFMPKGKMLFAVRRPSAKQERIFTSNQDPAFQGVVVTLVNGNTAGAGEVVAAVLRTLENALVVGQKTAGEAAEFTELPLRGGKLLRVAVAEVKLPEDLIIFPGGLKPDVAVEIPAKTEAEVLRLGLEKGVSGLVFESERARLNEAALVAGVNPELDAAEEAQKNGGSRKALSVTDTPLQRAVDLVTAIGMFGGKPAR